jgi:hypothetical protein
MCARSKMARCMRLIPWTLQSGSEQSTALSTYANSQLVDKCQTNKIYNMVTYGTTTVTLVTTSVDSMYKLPKLKIPKSVCHRLLSVRMYTPRHWKKGGATELESWTQDEQAKKRWLLLNLHGQKFFERKATGLLNGTAVASWSLAIWSETGLWYHPVKGICGISTKDL